MGTSTPSPAGPQNGQRRAISVRSLVHTCWGLWSFHLASLFLFSLERLEGVVETFVDVEGLAVFA